MWDLLYSETFEVWQDALPVSHQDKIMSLMPLLEQDGPNLKRPYVGKIVGSKVIPNLKELIVQEDDAHYRCFFAFDENRSAWFLIGGDKSPSFKSEKAKEAWYAKHIKLAEEVWLKEVKGGT